MLGNYVNQIRWNSVAIGCDQRPSLPRYNNSNEKFDDDDDESRERSAIPFNIRRMIETGEGFSFALPPPDPCGYPRRAYYAKDDKEVEETRKSCATPRCENTLSVTARRDYCHTCRQAQAAKKVRDKYDKMAGVRGKGEKRVHDTKASG